MISGSIGMLASASLAEGTFGLYELSTVPHRILPVRARPIRWQPFCPAP